MLYATIGGKPDIPLLFLDGSAVKVSSDANGDVVLDGTVAKLTPTAASALNTAFGTTALKAGLPLGTVHLVAKGTPTTYTDKVADISRLTGVSTSVALNPKTAAALQSLGVSVAPNGSGTFDSATSTVSFPITGGMAVIHTDKSYKPGYIAGVVIHQGSGLTFTKGTTSLALTDFVVDPGDSTLTATVGGKVGVPILSLDGSDGQSQHPRQRRRPRRHRRQTDPHRRLRAQRHLRHDRLHRRPAARHRPPRRRRLTLLLEADGSSLPRETNPATAGKWPSPRGGPLTRPASVPSRLDFAAD